MTKSRLQFSTSNILLQGEDFGEYLIYYTWPNAYEIISTSVDTAVSWLAPMLISLSLPPPLSSFAVTMRVAMSVLTLAILWAVLSLTLT